MSAEGRVARGMASAWAMARGAPGWAERTPMDASAVFASFWALPLSLPAIVLTHEVARRLQAARPGQEEMAVLLESPMLFGAAGVAAALASWAASLWVLTTLARRGSEGWRISPLLVGYNWSRLIVNLVAGLGAGLGVATGQPILFSLVSPVVGGLTLFLDIGILQRALALPLGRALGAVMVVLLARGIAGALAAAAVTLAGGALPS